MIGKWKYFDCSGICYCTILDAVVSHENVTETIGKWTTTEIKTFVTQKLKKISKFSNQNRKFTFISTPGSVYLLLLGVAMGES